MRVVKVFFLALCLLVLGGCFQSSTQSTTDSIPEATTEDPIPEITVETNVKMGEIIFDFTINDESKVKNIAVINKNTGQGKSATDNSITIEAEYNVSCNYDIVIYDYNDKQTTFTSITIKPGSLTNPYEISNVQELNDIRENLKAAYILTNDIDLLNEEWQPIGYLIKDENKIVSFEGNLNGNNHIINNLTAQGEMEFFGFFFANSGTIKNIGFHNVNIDITGTAGGITAINYYGKIESSYVTGSIKGDIVGGIAAGNMPNMDNNAPAYIEESYTDVVVQGIQSGGGLVGENQSYIQNSYALGDVISTSYAGGLVGINKGEVNNSYALGKITTNGEYSRLGGLVGANSGKIANSFASGDVISTSSAGGLVGINKYNKIVGEVINSYRYTGQLVTAEYEKSFLGNNIDNDDLITEKFYQDRLLWSNEIWDFTNISNYYYPVHLYTEKAEAIAIPEAYRLGTVGNPNKISTAEELLNIGSDVQTAYTLTSDIDLAGYEWVPIEGFMGEFIGNGKVVNNLTITTVGDEEVNYIGLFADNKGMLRNIELENININVSSSNVLFIGGLVGQNFNIIKNSSVTSGSIEVNGFSEIGGLVGRNDGNISNTYVYVDITATHYSHVSIGGLVGNQANGEISFSYTKGELSGIVESTDSTYVGGLAGKVEKGLIKNSFTLSNMTSNGQIGYLVGNGKDNLISNSFQYENQITKDNSEEGILPVDNDFTNISVVTSADLGDINWYQEILGFESSVWYFDSVTEGNYPLLLRQ